MTRLLTFTALPWTPPASTSADAVDLLFFVIVGICCLVVLLVAALVLVYCIRYRAGSRASREGRVQHTTPLELTLLATTLVAFLGMGAWGSIVFVHQQTPPLDADPIYVFGKQWMWKIEHPDGRREINELHVPIGEDTRLVIASDDVIHSFFVPAFRLKQDAVPGRYTSLWFHPTRVGTYHLFCAEYCGAQHSAMQGVVVVMTKDDYAKWLADRPLQDKVPGMPGTPEAPLHIGQSLFDRLGCVACHVHTGRVLAPQLSGLWGRPTKLDTGREIVVDDNYIRESILDPNAKIVAGYASPSVMPSYRGQVNEEDLRTLINYIRSIRDGWPTLPEKGSGEVGSLRSPPRAQPANDSQNKPPEPTNSDPNQ